MSISEKDVLVAARLAKLELDPKDVTHLTEELKKILGYVDQLGQLDTTGVEPTTQVGTPAAPLRPDVVTPGANKAEVLAAAARADETGFLVPGFVDGS